jgi:cysteinyl-tRNA synthetase
MTQIQLHNTRTRRKEPFTPIDADNVRMYVCGPTVYDRAHLGNARPVVVFDVLYRLLRHVYGPGNVTYVRNFTDVDDKINARARALQEAGDPRDMNAIIRTLTDETINWYHADMDALGSLRPTHEPRATEFIGDKKEDGSWSGMIGMIETLTNLKSDVTGEPFAYEEQRHVLFDVRAYSDYGKLSGRSIDDMIAGARVEIAPYKRNPMDFVLWKPSTPEEPGWESPWGRGRPGWHIECSAMAHELLGESFDIHGGGIDLQFPHHENEIAQSCCAYPNGDFAKVWLHNEMVQVDGKKMSKSLGNFFTVRNLLENEHCGAEIRYVFLMTHYRSPMDWTAEKAATAWSKLRGYLMLGARFADLELARKTKVAAEVISALSDDLNTHLALVEVDRLLGEAKWEQLVASLDFLGLFPFSRFEEMQQTLKAAYVQISMQTERFNSLRAAAMSSRDFSALDALKSRLADAGIEVQMTKARVDLITGPNFDPAKLDALK